MRRYPGLVVMLGILVDDGDGPFAVRKPTPELVGHHGARRSSTEDEKTFHASMVVPTESGSQRRKTPLRGTCGPRLGETGAALRVVGQLPASAAHCGVEERDHCAFP